MIIRVCGLQRSGTNYLFELLNKNLKDKNHSISYQGKHRRLFTHKEFRKEYIQELKENKQGPPIELKGMHADKQIVHTMNDFLKHMDGDENHYFLYTIKSPHHWITSYHNSGHSNGASYWQMIYEYEFFLDKLIMVKNQDKDRQILSHSYDYISQYPKDYLNSISTILNINLSNIPLGKNQKVPMSTNFNKKNNNNRIKDDYIYERTNRKQREYIDLFLTPLYIEATNYYLTY